LPSDTLKGLTDPILATLRGMDRYRYFRRRLWDHHGRLCGICGEPLDLEEMHADHVTPLSDGGADEWFNLRPAHRKCNISRGNESSRREFHLRSSPIPDVKRKVLVMLKPELYEHVKKLARTENRSVSNQVAWLIKRGLEPHP
jgi:hypothetical protein